MNRGAALPSLLALLVGLGCAATQTRPEANATLTRADAMKLALAKVPNGSSHTVQEGKLETEHGRLVWSFDIASPDTSDITEVQVDAKTGEIVSVEKETPAQQQAEKQADEKKSRPGK